MTHACSHLTRRILYCCQSVSLPIKDLHACDLTTLLFDSHHLFFKIKSFIVESISMPDRHFGNYVAGKNKVNEYFVHKKKACWRQLTMSL